MKFFQLFALLLFTTVMFSQYTESEWTKRDSWMNVEDIFSKAEIHKGSFVADIGCHEGYLSIHLAKKVGVEGKVFSVDVREDRLEALDENLKSRNLSNVDVILGDYDNPKLPQNKLDVVVIMDTYHEIVDNMIVLEHVHKSLKPGGRIVIIEKLKSRIKGKSRESQIDAHSLSPKYVKQELTESGFVVTYQNDDMGNWENDEGKVIWMLVAKKSKI